MPITTSQLITAVLSAVVLSITAAGCSPMAGPSDRSAEASITAPANGLLAAHRLRCEYLVNPLGVGETKPRLSWELISTARGARQTAYQIEVAASPEGLKHGKTIWDSQKVLSDATNQIAYAGSELKSRQQCVWRVRSWNESDKPSAWSEPATWEMGLLSREDWKAKFIDSGDRLKNEFKIVSATFHSIDSEGSADVTEALKSHVKEGELHIEVNPKTLGNADPAYNHRKQLTIKYTLGGRELEYETNENVRLDLPTPAVHSFATTFNSTRRPVRARLFATAFGVYAAELNGKHVGDQFLAPGWTDYRYRARYQVYDVTDLVKQGANQIAIGLAAGWYSGNIGNHEYRHYGKQPAVMAQVILDFSDGTTQVIGTDEKWRVTESPVIAADNMAGEVYDARPPKQQVSTTYDAATVREVPASIAINPQVAEPVRELKALPAKTVIESPKGSGHYVFDFSQNMVGLTRLKTSGPAGTRITLRYVEVLNEDGSVYTTNLRGASAADEYFCSGDGEEIYQPTFTFHGFRYVEVIGLPHKPSLDTLTGIVLGSDSAMNGTFETSDARVNQLQSNIQWGQRGNFLSVPTDCPQRDERQGWTGDGEVFISTAVRNADVAAFFSKWLVDLTDGQTAEGGFPNVAPNVSRGRGSPAWADAGTICPWTIYETYGDRRVLESAYPSMKKWVEWCEKYSTNGIRDKDRGDDFGDWLSNEADTSKELIGTAFYARSTELTAKAARVLGHNEEAEKYERLAAEIKAAFCKKYVATDGKILGDTQTAYAIALAFDLLDETTRPLAAKHLEQNVVERNNHLSTGFVGVSHLLPTLADGGFSDAAYRLLMQDSFPSWLFSVKHGATTIWERWDGWTPDKRFQDPGMNSFNHYSLGSCGQWFYSGIAGIQQQPGSTGYRSLIIAPQLPPINAAGKCLLTHAAATFHSINGPIKSGWTIDGDKLELKISIPANCTALIKVPTSDIASITESGKAPSAATGFSQRSLDQSAEQSAPQYIVGAGEYVFHATLK